MSSNDEAPGPSKRTAQKRTASFSRSSSTEHSDGAEANGRGSSTSLRQRLQTDRAFARAFYTPSEDSNGSGSSGSSQPHMNGNHAMNGSSMRKKSRTSTGRERLSSTDAAAVMGWTGEFPKLSTTETINDGDGASVSPAELRAVGSTGLMVFPRQELPGPEITEPPTEGDAEAPAAVKIEPNAALEEEMAVEQMQQEQEQEQQSPSPSPASSLSSSFGSEPNAEPQSQSQSPSQSQSQSQCEIKTEEEPEREATTSPEAAQPPSDQETQTDPQRESEHDRERAPESAPEREPEPEQAASTSAQPSTDEVTPPPPPTTTNSVQQRELDNNQEKIRAIDQQGSSLRHQKVALPQQAPALPQQRDDAQNSTQQDAQQNENDPQNDTQNNPQNYPQGDQQNNNDQNQNQNQNQGDEEKDEEDEEKQQQLLLLKQKFLEEELRQNRLLDNSRLNGLVIELDESTDDSDVIIVGSPPRPFRASSPMLPMDAEVMAARWGPRQETVAQPQSQPQPQPERRLSVRVQSRPRKHGPRKRPATDSFYRLPFFYGWKRQLVLPSIGNHKRRTGDVFFIAPNGRRMRSRDEIIPHLQGDLTIEHFCFQRKPQGAGPEYEMVRHAASIPSRRTSKLQDQAQQPQEQPQPQGQLPSTMPLVEPVKRGRRPKQLNVRPLAGAANGSSGEEAAPSGSWSARIRQLMMNPNPTDSIRFTIVPTDSANGNSSGEAAPTASSSVRASSSGPPIRATKPGGDQNRHRLCVTCGGPLPSSITSGAKRSAICQDCLASTSEDEMEIKLPSPKREMEMDPGDSQDTYSNSSMIEIEPGPFVVPFEPLVPVPVVPNAPFVVVVPDNPVIVAPSSPGMPVVPAAPVVRPGPAMPVVPAAPVVRPVPAAPAVRPVPAAPVVRPVLAAPAVRPVIAAPVVRPVIAAPVVRPVIAAPVVRPGPAAPAVLPLPAAPVVLPLPPVPFMHTLPDIINVNIESDDSDDEPEAEREREPVAHRPITRSISHRIQEVVVIQGRKAIAVGMPALRPVLVPRPANLVNYKRILGKANHRDMVAYLGECHMTLRVLQGVMKILGLKDRLNMAKVCNSWAMVGRERSVWSSVSLRDTTIDNWVFFLECLAIKGTRELDMQGVIMANPQVRLGGDMRILHALKVLRTDACEAEFLQLVFRRLPPLRELRTVCTSTSLSLANLDQLEELRVLRLRMTDPRATLTSMNTLAKLKHVTMLSLRGITNLGRLNLTHLKVLTQLNVLTLGYAQDIDGAHLGKDVLPALKQLHTFRLENDHRGLGLFPVDDIMTGLAAAGNLRQLELLNVDIDDGFSAMVTACPLLKELLLAPNCTHNAATMLNAFMETISSNSDQLHIVRLGLINELLSATGNLYRGSGKDVIPVRRPVPGIPERDPLNICAPGEYCHVMKDHSQCVAFLPVDRLESILHHMIPQSWVSVVKVAMCETAQLEFPPRPHNPYAAQSVVSVRAASR